MGRTVTLPTPKRLAHEYERGSSFRVLATRYGTTERTIRRHIGSHVKARRTGPPKAPPTDEEIIAFKDAGWSWQEVADQVGMSRTGVRARYIQATTGQRPWR